MMPTELLPVPMARMIAALVSGVVEALDEEVAMMRLVLARINMPAGRSNELELPLPPMRTWPPANVKLSSQDRSSVARCAPAVALVCWTFSQTFAEVLGEFGLPTTKLPPAPRIVA